MWNPPIALTSEEQKIAARTRKTRKFFVFLRERRHELLDADFQHALANSSSPEPGGREPVEVGLLALATLLQAYGHVGDRDAVELTVMDKRWQMVLDCLGAEHPPVSQGTLLNFRLRLITHNVDKTLLDRTVALAEHTGGFGARQLRAVLASPPLFGAGRGEDTLNLLGHALRKAVDLVAPALGTSAEAVVEDAGLTLGGHSSLKAALDLDWGSPARGSARWAWSWRRGNHGNAGWRSSSPWRPRHLLCRRSWRPSHRLSRRTPSQTRRVDRAGDVSRSTSRLTGASLSRIKTCATAAKAAPKPSTASRNTLPWMWRAKSPGRWWSARRMSRSMRR